MAAAAAATAMLLSFAGASPAEAALSAIAFTPVSVSPGRRLPFSPMQGISPSAPRRKALPLSAAKAPAGRSRDAVHIISSMHKNRFFILSVPFCTISVKRRYDNVAVEAPKDGIVGGLLKPKLQCYILSGCIVEPCKIKGVLILCLRYFCAVPLYTRSFPAKVIIIAVRHLYGIIAAVVELVGGHFKRAAYAQAVNMSFFKRDLVFVGRYQPSAVDLFALPRLSKTSDTQLVSA